MSLKAIAPRQFSIAGTAILLVVSALWCLAVTSATAQENQPKSRKTKTMPGVTPAREAAAMAFVREHHADLEELLKHLKANQEKQYQAAIRDLFRISERLANFHERDRGRYELELQSWKLKSRVQLMAARLSMSPKDKRLREQLKEILTDELAIRRKVLELERERASERIKKLDAQIRRIDTAGEQMVQRQLKLLLQGPKSTTSGKQEVSVPANKRGRE